MKMLPIASFVCIAIVGCTDDAPVPAKPTAVVAVKNKVAQGKAEPDASSKAEARYEGRPTSQWVEQLKDASWGTRMKAANALAVLGADTPAVVPALAAELNHGDEFDREQYSRRAAAAALGRIGAKHPEALPALVKILQDTKESGNLRADVAAALGKGGGQDATVRKALVAAVADANEHVAQQAAQVLNGMEPGTGDRVVVSILLGQLRAANADKRMEALRKMSSLRDACRQDASVPPALVLALKDDETGVRHAAAVFLGQLNVREKEAIHGLAQAMRDRDCNVHKAAGAALREIDPDVFAREKIPAALDLLNGPDDARRSAVETLAEVGGKDAAVLDALAGAMKDWNASVRRTAQDAVRRHHPQEYPKLRAVAEMYLLREESDPLERVSAVEVLQNLAEAAQPGGTGKPDVALVAEIYRALAGALGDRDGIVRFAAASAFRRVTNERIVKALAKDEVIVKALGEAMIDQKLRTYAGETLERLDSDTYKRVAVRIAMRDLESTDTTTLSNSMRILQKFRVKDEAVLRKLAEHAMGDLSSGGEVRRASTWYLIGKDLDPQGFRKALTAAALARMNAPQQRLRYAAVNVLAEADRDPAVLKALEAALKDSDVFVRGEAARALKRMR